MKIKLLIILITTFIVSCGTKKEKKKDKFEYKRTKVEALDDVDLDDPNKVKIVLNSFDSMEYDKKIIEVEDGKNIYLTLNHMGKIGKEFMGHNFVLLKKGTNVDDFARKAVVAKKTDYIPEGNETIAFTKMIGGGETTTINFKTPEPGKYVFICSFPGHYNLMKGEFIVKEK